MKKKICSVIIFYDNDKILLQDRREMNEHGEEYGFFGGGREGEENPKENLARELKEELDIDVYKLKDLMFFKKFNIKHYDLELDVDLHVFLAKIPNLSNISVNEGKLFITNFKHAFNLKMIKGDIKILKEVYEHLQEKRKPLKTLNYKNYYLNNKTW